MISWFSEIPKLAILATHAKRALDKMEFKCWDRGSEGLESLANKPKNKEYST